MKPISSLVNVDLTEQTKILRGFFSRISLYSGRRRGLDRGKKAFSVSGAGVGQDNDQELGKQLGRHPSMISRLIRDYEGKQDRRREAKLARALAKVQTHA